MCFKFKKSPKKERVNIAKFSVGDFVDFRHYDDLYFGYVDDIYKLENQIFYDINIGGQCPTTVEKVPEELVIRIHK